MKISELQREERLLIIEEARLLRDRDQVDDAIQRDVDIQAFVMWANTRQGFRYWMLIHSNKK